MAYFSPEFGISDLAEGDLNTIGGADFHCFQAGQVLSQTNLMPGFILSLMVKQKCGTTVKSLT